VSYEIWWQVAGTVIRSKIRIDEKATEKGTVKVHSQTQAMREKYEA
jgi:hypothetical protein